MINKYCLIIGLIFILFIECEKICVEKNDCDKGEICVKKDKFNICIKTPFRKNKITNFRNNDNEIKMKIDDILKIKKEKEITKNEKNKKSCGTTKINESF